MAQAFAAAALLSARNALVASRGPTTLGWPASFRLKLSLRRALESANDAAELTPRGNASRVCDALASYVKSTMAA
jgi:Arc/MetJ family transcription regulator